MRKELEIITFEPKRSKNGKEYNRFKTPEGWMSVFESDVAENLKKAEGKIAIVEVAESEQGFKNIRAYYGLASENQSKSEDLEIEVVNPYTGQKKEAVISPSKNTTMYVSYAKDIYLGLLEKLKIEDKIDFDGSEELMNHSIRLVKQAIKEFI